MSEACTWCDAGPGEACTKDCTCPDCKADPTKALALRPCPCGATPTSLHTSPDCPARHGRPVCNDFYEGAMGGCTRCTHLEACHLQGVLTIDYILPDSLGSAGPLAWCRHCGRSQETGKDGGDHTPECALVRSRGTDVMARLLAQAVITAHNDPGVGALGDETQELLADAYHPARTITEHATRYSEEIDWGSYTDPTMDPRAPDAKTQPPRDS